MRLALLCSLGHSRAILAWWLFDDVRFCMLSFFLQSINFSSFNSLSVTVYKYTCSKTVCFLWERYPLQPWRWIWRYFSLPSLTTDHRSFSFVDLLISVNSGPLSTVYWLSIPWCSRGKRASDILLISPDPKSSISFGLPLAIWLSAYLDVIRTTSIWSSSHRSRAQLVYCSPVNSFWNPLLLGKSMCARC